jgi:2-phosphosulfolactate phosphatase
VWSRTVAPEHLRTLTPAGQPGRRSVHNPDRQTPRHCNTVTVMNDWSGQLAYGVRMEWGLTGAKHLTGACVVIVDVLSFTTSVTVVVEAGTRVFPYQWRDESAVEFARQVRAPLAVGRRAVTEQSPWSLSPAALRKAPKPTALVLPSPNGSSIAAAMSEAIVMAGCLRNASAVGRALTARGFGSVEKPIVVIAAGERWPDDQLRPALEDLLGAGAIIRALGQEVSLSPEAQAARSCFMGTANVPSAVAACSSGLELREGGFSDDVTIAAELDACDTVPALIDGDPQRRAFVALD